MTSTIVDPYARMTVTSRHQFLYALNPLAKVAGFAPAMIFLVFVRDLATPTAFLLLAYVLLLVGARLTWRLLLLLAVLPVGMAVIGGNEHRVAQLLEQQGSKSSGFKCLADSVGCKEQPLEHVASLS